MIKIDIDMPEIYTKLRRKKMYNYRYDLISADLEYNIKKHPQDDLNDRGLKWIKCEPFSIGDCWIFRFNKSIENCPPYLTRISDNFKFSDEKE